MDLGIKGRRAIVCGASKGLGHGCAAALAREGVAVLMVARSQAPVQEAAGRLAREGLAATALSADVTTEEGRAAILAACPEPDILVNNAGGPPPGDFRDWSRDDWIKALDANMLSAIFLIRSVVDGMMARGFGRVVNITSSSVKAPINILGLSNGARSGLTGFVAGIARETVGRNVTINNLLPGSFLTDRLTSAFAGWAARDGTSVEQAVEKRKAEIPAGRFGNAEEFGAFCAFLCSAQASYFTGQNVLLDGGAYPGTY